MVLLVVDTQKAITNSDLYQFEQFETNIKELIYKARQKDIEVIFVRHDDGTIEEMKINENNKESKPQWKGCIIFGIINIVFVLLCTKLNIIMLSVALILLIAAGVVTTIQSIKEDWQEGFKVSAIGCIVGLLLNCFAAVLYVFNVLSSILGIFSVFIK